MIFTKDRYCRINIRLFFSFAQMPNQGVILSVALTSFCSFICATFAICQIADIVVNGFDLRRALLIIPTTMSMLTCLGIILIFRANQENLAQFFDLIPDAFPFESDEEFTIMKKSFDFTKRIIKFTTSVIGTFSAPLIPQFLDIVLPENETRPRQHILLGEYFVDEEEYFYLIMCYQAAAGFSVLLVAGVTINVAVMVCRYVFAVLAIFGYRMESINPAEEAHGSQTDFEIFMLWRIGRCVKEHLKILQMISLLNIFTEWLLLLCLVATMISLIPTLAEVTDIELIEPRSVLFAGTQMGQFFVVSLLGQQMIDATTILSQRVYNFRWYECPVRAQKLLLFIILRMFEPVTLGTKGIFVLSLKSFGAVIHAAVSYCMVLRQFR